MNALISLAELEKLACSHDHVTCPCCGHKHPLVDEVTQAVVSYWGDDLHNFSCFKCGKDFVVREIVTRKFETAATPEGLP